MALIVVSEEGGAKAAGPDGRSLEPPVLLPDGRGWATPTDGVRDFPAMCVDGEGIPWLAVLVRLPSGRLLGVTRPGEGGDWKDADLAVPGATGLGPPAICPLAAGCAVAAPVEMDDRWRIACFFVGMDGVRNGGPVFLDAGGTANCTPALAEAGSAVWVLWQSNASGPALEGHEAGTAGPRGICGARVTAEGCGEVVRLSAAGSNSQNPAIVGLDGGEAFAAWDSVRGAHADIFGARLGGGAWSAERRLTSDARIERHPHLAARDGEVWMAWEARSYEGRRLNRLTEQRAVVARLDPGGSETAPGWFDEVSPPEALLVRPRIAFDAEGRLWLTCRRSLGPQAGWQPEVRALDGAGWSSAAVPTRHAGRWRPVPLALVGRRALWACQCDDLPTTWNEQGVWPEWHSWIEVGALRVHAAPGRARAACGSGASRATEPLRMPETAFDLAERRALSAADLQGRRARVGGADLVLLWGDLHDHTDLSVCDRAKNPPGDDLFANERDIEGLDFCALTDHGYNMDHAQWAHNAEQTRMYHDPGRFVTFLGQEWTSEVAPPEPGGEMNRYGHRNLIFLDPYHPRHYDAHDGDVSPADLWRELGGAEVLCIPHQLACWEGKGRHNVPVQWGYADERIQPVAEICQTRGSYEGLGCPYQSPGATPWRGHFLQDAWRRGIVIGVVAGPDHGGGKGKVGVWAKDRTREEIFAAIRARHTFGTSGPKMSLLFRSGDLLMGDVSTPPADLPAPRKRQAGGPPAFTVEASALRPIKVLSILRNNEVVFEVNPDRRDLHLDWQDAAGEPTGPLWYYVRMSTGEGEWAWSSPIWFLERPGSGA